MQIAGLQLAIVYRGLIEYRAVQPCSSLDFRTTLATHYFYGGFALGSGVSSAPSACAPRKAHSSTMSYNCFYLGVCFATTVSRAAIVNSFSGVEAKHTAQISRAELHATSHVRGVGESFEMSSVHRTCVIGSSFIPKNACHATRQSILTASCLSLSYKCMISVS
jgi:hypothetical protein